MKKKRTPAKSLDDLVKGIRTRVRNDKRTYRELVKLCNFGKSYSYFAKLIQGEREMTLKNLAVIASLYVDEINFVWKD